MALVLCKWCKKEDEKVNLIKKEIAHIRSKAVRDDKGKIVNKKGDTYTSKINIHAVCVSLYEKDKEFKKEESIKKDKMSVKIAEVYGLESIQLIPPQFFPFLEDVRNDSKLFGKLGKNYKQGIPYEAIAYTYEFCKDIIRDAKEYKMKKGENFKNLLSELIYGLTIVKNNFVDAKNDSERKHKQKIEKERMQQQTETKDMTIEVESNYKKKKTGDISNLL